MLQLQTLIKCLDKLDNHLVEILKRHHQMFSFRTEEGIDYLSLHVEYVVCGYCVLVNFSVTVFVQVDIHTYCTCDAEYVIQMFVCVFV